MARNKSRPRKGRTTGKKSNTGKGSNASSQANADATQADLNGAADAPVIEGRPQEVKKKANTNPLEFFQQVRNEGEKVSWTGRNETVISTIMVLIMVAIMVLFFFIVDQVLRLGITTVLSIT